MFKFKPLFCTLALVAGTAQATESKSVDLLIPEERLEIYAPFTLTADLSALSAGQTQMIGLLIDAAHIMDELFWDQAFGLENRDVLMQKVADKPAVAEFIRTNYGPWDRLDGDAQFIAGYGAKALGANFYPTDMTKEEFEDWDQAGKRGLYSVVRRSEGGKLQLEPYSVQYRDRLMQASALLSQAAGLADNPEFAHYLRLRAAALLDDDYLASDMAWMDMKTNPVELVIGPIENYEDKLYGYRTAFSAYVLLKDLAWSERLARFASYLPELQKGLPVADEYKQEMPGTDSDLNAYDVLFYAGDSNAGSKTIAINLPNDERLQLEKGTRRLQLKNAMRAKFDEILVPIAGELITPEQRKYITFDAFFANTMFHEVAHGLGIKNTINDQGTVRVALKETAGALEEGKADILGLYMVTELHKRGAITEGEVMDNYVTFLASIFRSVRFGASSAHGRANMVRFNYFREAGAFSRDESGHYSVDFDRMQQAMADLSCLILTLQGNGDYEGVKKLLDEKGVIGPGLQSDLDRLGAAGIPVDIVFRQGKEYLDLK
ncbi:Zn-dependent hydrolase [Parahaliea maris]|uniref:Zn-dependent hydrolase n=1 Tax=Parahaliea maris TaxID=2716870 RepID=A0A5C8ZMB8_9GAMM|nr:Zn-dependent hydrolase [Parahaliea maris]TXS88904.1 Zn-dependent hydrolase [Parahaliea maris]